MKEVLIWGMHLGLHLLASQQLWLWFEAGQIQPLNLIGDLEKCCRCISWMQREVLVAKQEMRNPESELEAGVCFCDGCLGI